MMFGWDREDREAAGSARENPDPKAWVVLAVCLTPPLVGLIFMIVRALID